MGETKKEILTRLKDIEAKLDRILSRAEVELTAQHEEAGGMNLAIQITGLARSSVYNLVSARQIPHYKKGRDYISNGENWKNGLKVADGRQSRKYVLMFGSHRGN